MRPLEFINVPDPLDGMFCATPAVCSFVDVAIPDIKRLNCVDCVGGIKHRDVVGRAEILNIHGSMACVAVTD
jgi:hypothetical protein